MAVFLDKLNRNFELLPEKLQPWRWWILGLYILLMLFLASGIPRFSFTWANDEMFGKNDPVQKSLDRIKELFGGTTAFPMIYRLTEIFFLKEASRRFRRPTGYLIRHMKTIPII